VKRKRHSNKEGALLGKIMSQVQEAGGCWKGRNWIPEGGRIKGFVERGVGERKKSDLHFHQGPLYSGWSPIINEKKRMKRTRESD